MNKLELGLMVGIGSDPLKSFQMVADLGIPTCQLSGGGEALMEGKYPSADLMRKEAEKAGVRISSVFLTWADQKYDNVDGPATMGLVPPDLRAKRLVSAKAFSDWVHGMGCDSVTCHIGFIPDDENDPIYPGFIDTMREICEHCANNDQIFCFETGQELASTLKRTIQDVGTGNLFINLDPANLILYAKSNPLDAVEIFGEYVRGLHAKDGVWPNRDEALGHEKALGEGLVRFDLLIRRLKEKGYTGPLTIEREISGDQQIVDIKAAMKLLEPML
jgi:L-ribulose-5-phosphate 3-epimerase